jgi:hypothetical protein
MGTGVELGTSFAWCRVWGRSSVFSSVFPPVFAIISLEHAIFESDLTKKKRKEENDHSPQQKSIQARTRVTQ